MKSSTKQATLLPFFQAQLANPNNHLIVNAALLGQTKVFAFSELH